MVKARSSNREPSREARRLARKQRRHAERRRAIMEAARQLLVSEGIDKFTVSSVAAVAEVSKPAVYYYFDSKEELVGALAADALEAETQVMHEAMQREGDGLAALEAATRAYVQHYSEDLDRFRILYVWAQVLGINDRVAETDACAARGRLDDALARRLEEEQGRGRLRTGLSGRKLVAVARATAQGIVCGRSLGQLAGSQAAFSAAELCDEACRSLRETMAGR
jgi:TetR/AcrR family transcriptional regulator